MSRPSAAVRAGGPPAHHLLGLQQLAGNRAVQRLMVRMPNPYECGMHRSVGDAEVDEIGRALAAKYAGVGGQHGWKDDWVFPPSPTTEPSVFYGHGNRSELGGLEPRKFAKAVHKPERALQQDTAFKFVSCGGGQGRAGEGAAYGAAVAAEIQSRDLQGKTWGGPLKATQGLVYYTEKYKAVLPEIPLAVTKLLSQKTEAAELGLRRQVVEHVRAKLRSVDDKKKRAADLRELRDLVVKVYTEGEKASRAEAVGKIAIPEFLSNTWLTSRLNDAMDVLFATKYGWTAVDAAVEGFSSGNCLADLATLFESLNKEMAVKAEGVWGEFRDALQHASRIPARGSAKVGTVDPAVPPDDSARFRHWQDFGTVPWKQWKASRNKQTD
ncbi:hypothetical protein SAMN05216553_11385 [Lentzea fradiae]|uniref:Uncharacterized protein n=1 Tax=Lentzea fradiae TaxID=200378 RepID=A0A1G7Y4Z3_9PSEU|nr:hypothetical protein [Lentzea fradiae]SDG91449.1 hypothetical protein SAMN05216553_11385 [Lentzea fradiae]